MHIKKIFVFVCTKIFYIMSRNGEQKNDQVSYGDIVNL